MTEVGQDTKVSQYTQARQVTEVGQDTKVSQVPQARQVTKVSQDTQIRQVTAPTHFWGGKPWGRG